MTKQEFIREQGVSQMPKLVQVLVGRLWDAAQAEGEKVGYRKGVDAVAKKQEFMREQGVSQMPKLVQVLVGRLWDAAQAEGEKVGYRKGVDAVAKKQEEIYKRMYDEGVHDVKKRLSVSFPAALGKVLHRDFRFGASRCNRVLDGVSQEMMTMIDPAEAVRECAEFGLMLDWDDPLSRDLEGY